MDHGGCLHKIYAYLGQTTIKPHQRIHRLGGSTKRPSLRRSPLPLQIQAEALLGALPHPLLVIGEGLEIDYVNTAAEDFFQMSAAVWFKQNAL